MTRVADSPTYTAAPFCRTVLVAGDVRQSALRLPGLTVTRLYLSSEAGKFDLSLALVTRHPETVMSCE